MIASILTHSNVSSILVNVLTVALPLFSPFSGDPFYDFTPTLAALCEVERQIGPHIDYVEWTKVAFHLDLESSLINMLLQNQSTELLSFTEMFEFWLSWEPGKRDKERTWHTVICAFEAAGLQKAVSWIMDHIYTIVHVQFNNV